MPSPRAPATTLAVDVGGTHMRTALVDEEGKVLLRRSLPTPRRAEVPAALTDLIRSVALGGDAGRPAAAEAVVGLPGPVDYRSGRLLWAPHLPETWAAQLSERQLSEQVGMAVRLANDADLAAVGEAYFGSGHDHGDIGSGRDHGDIAFLTISTGIGAGVVVGGRLVFASRSLAELGHTIIDRDAWEAGRPATLEELASGSGLTRMAAEAGLGALDGEGVEDLFSSGHPAAVRIWNGAVAAASIGVTNLAWSFCPRLVVIGGGLGRRPAFYDALRATVERRAPVGLPEISLALSSLGDDAGLVGAARWSEAVPVPPPGTPGAEPSRPLP